MLVEIINRLNCEMSGSPHLDQCGHRVHFVQVLGDTFHQVGHRHTDGPGGVALQLDNLVGSAVKTQDKKQKIKNENGLQS